MTEVFVSRKYIINRFLRSMENKVNSANIMKDANKKNLITQLKSFNSPQSLRRLYNFRAYIKHSTNLYDELSVDYTDEASYKFEFFES